MNAIRGMVDLVSTISSLSLRGYRTNGGRTWGKRLKPPRQTEMVQPGMPVADFLEDELENPEDLDAFESNFQSVGEYDKMHERELEVKKAKLMTQIVKQKYFKSKEPALLTWGEKEQIRLLHSQDPKEWTPEKLSESFPASREAILKVLRSKWEVKSAKVVEKYERKVKKNWALLKMGKLEIDPETETRLAEFKNRKIDTMDPETIAKKILKPEPQFPKPQSTIFSDIIQGYLDENPVDEDDGDFKDDELPVEKPLKNKSFKRIISNELTVKEKSKESATTMKLATEVNISRNKSLTFDQFLQKYVQNIEENNMTPVDRVLVDQLKLQTTESYKTKSLMFDSASPVAAWKQQDELKEKRANATKDDTASVSESEKTMETRLARQEKNKDLAVPEISMETSVQPELNILEGSLETGIIVRQKTEVALQDDYPDFIRIPVKKYKFGVTYRVQDRYYDDDGELLYRVPGLKT